MIITRAPLRVSFFGGGTDYPSHFLRYGGAVLGSAIDQYAFMTASRFRSSGLFDYRIRCSYREIEHVQTLDEVQHGPIREALRQCGLERDVELHHIADLPAKTGLGSSSSFVVSLLQALHKLNGKDRKGLDLAYEAIHLERHILGESVGCQDQTLAAVGGFNIIEFRREDDISVNRVPIGPKRLKELEAHLMMVYTGITRQADQVVRTQLTKADENRKRYARMRRQVDVAFDILVNNQAISAFGALLDAAWAEKRALHAIISTDVIDKMYATAKEAGALGGKLLGAGGGGFLLLFVPPERQDEVALVFKEKFILRPRLDAPGSSVIFDGSKMRAPVAKLRQVAGEPCRPSE